MSDDASSDRKSISVCPTHGLRFDPSRASGCIRCDRDASRAASKSVLLWCAGALVAAVTALGAYLVYAHRAPASPAAASTPKRGLEARLATVNSFGRSGSYYLPADFESKSIPLAVILHGTGGDGASMIAAFRDLADETKFAVVAPESGNSPDGRANWAVGDHPGEVSDDYRHVMDCIAEVRAIPRLQIDVTHVLIAGHSGGASSAPYIASNETLFTSFAVLHGGIFPGGIGPRHVRGWFSTGRGDTLRPQDGVAHAADTMRSLGFGDIELHLYDGGHDLSIAERRELVRWWLR